MLRKFSGSNRVEKGTFCLSPKIRPPELGELLNHGRRAEEEENTEIRVVSGKTTLIPHLEIDQLSLQKTIVL